MSNNNFIVKNIQSRLKELSGIESVSEVKINGNIIKHITIQSASMGTLIVSSLQTKDSTELFNFYFHGLSKLARIFFCPYPLFNPLPNDPRELSKKIKEWKKEFDWIVLKLLKNSQIIGICLLKRYKTERPTSGLAIHEKFQKMGLGILLQTIINEQARLLRIKKLTITLAQNNIASLKVHEKAEFKKTGRLVPHFTYIKGVKKMDRYDIEMIKKFSYK